MGSVYFCFKVYCVDSVSTGLPVLSLRLLIYTLILLMSDIDTKANGRYCTTLSFISLYLFKFTIFVF